MYRIFNCGIGMVLIVNTEDVSSIQSIIDDHGYKNFEIGFIERSAQTNISYI
jgi:phosphoribosylformylglycinamidine cyclo-ligase